MRPRELTDLFVEAGAHRHFLLAMSTYSENLRKVVGKRTRREFSIETSARRAG
jgi:hypothetical protein